MCCDNLTTAWLNEDLGGQDELAYRVAQGIEGQRDLDW